MICNGTSELLEGKEKLKAQETKLFFDFFVEEMEFHVLTLFKISPEPINKM